MTTPIQGNSDATDGAPWKESPGILRVITRQKFENRSTPSRRQADGAASSAPTFFKAAENLAAIGRGFYSRGWVLGTSGNFSAVVSREPLRLTITSTGLDKGSLRSAQFVEIDDEANAVRGNGRPSAEALLHLAVV